MVPTLLQDNTPNHFNSSPIWLVRYVLKGTDALSFLIKLQDGRVIQRHQDHMRARLSFSESISPTPVNNLGSEQIESRLPPQPETAPRVPIHTPDTVIPDTVILHYRNQLLRYQPHCENLSELKNHNQLLRCQPHRDDPLEKSEHPNVSVPDKVWIWSRD